MKNGTFNKNCTAKQIWDRSIFSYVKPTYEHWLFVDLCFFYRLLRVAILKLWCKSTTSKQKQFCDHVPHIIINPGKLSRISKQYHIRQQICNSVWWILSCHFTEKCAFYQKLYILPKIVHSIKNWLFNQ